MNPILPQVEELISTFKQLMPTLYQQETLSSIFGLFLEGKVKLPHHCTTKSESAISMGLAQTRWQKNSTICHFYQTDERHNYHQMG